MTAQTTPPPIPASQLMANEVERGLREQQVGIFFVMPRVVRRVLQNELEITSPWQPPPHRKCCTIERDRLLWIVARDELGVEPNAKLPEQIILVAQPEEDQLATMTRIELQRHYWRLMYHARIDFVMAARTSSDQMTAADLRHRIDQLGQSAFDEIRSVLRIEQMLVRPGNDRNVYAEFVAVYLELRAFAPQLVPIYFPSLPSPDQVLAVIEADCPARELFESTRPHDLTNDDAVARTDENLPATSEPEVKTSERRPSPRKYAKLVKKAEQYSSKGNNVRAALTLQQAVAAAPDELLDEAKSRFDAEVQKLVDRLQSAIEMTEDSMVPWKGMCVKLLAKADRRFWNVNARLLYDIQNACFDHEREIYKVDLVRWAFSLGKKPLKHPLSNQRVVLMSKHLRAANARITQVDIDAAGRSELNELLNRAAGAAEHILRTRLEPLIEAVLLEAGFWPESVVERVALKKMVRELADDAVDRGFITLGSLRDAVSRNQLKMPDLSGFSEFLNGDPLLRADRLMSAAIDGVYSRGPFYLRWLQKINSLAYGIPWGRLFIRYVALPFGLAFLLLKTIDVAAEHLPFIHAHEPDSAVHEVHRTLPVKATVVTPKEVAERVEAHEEAKAEAQAQAEAEADAESEAQMQSIEHQDIASIPQPEQPPHREEHSVTTPAVKHHVDLFYSHQSMFLLGLLIFALIHFPHFRRAVVWSLKACWNASRIVFFEIPMAIVRWPPIEQLLKSFPMMLFRRFVLAPVIATVVFWQVLPWLSIYGPLNRWWGVGIFLLSFIALNSRVGRDTEELAREFFSRTWYRIRVHLVMGIFTLIIDIFRALMDGLERVLYAVDEWLRFRSGESEITLAIKAVFGLVWSVIHGFVRFCVTLLIEPQVNPIKHFPVVTVSHKLVITTLTVPIATFLTHFFEKPATAYTVTALILTSIPGVFGFLAWELKENWRLYKANRSPKLKPVPIGDHGETLLRLLCPGFHSGTVPRLFTKLRRMARRDAHQPTSNKQAKFALRLHHEATALKHFLEREFVALLHESGQFQDGEIAIRDVLLTTNRVLVTVDNVNYIDKPMKLEFTEQSAWLLGSIQDPGWLIMLAPEQVDVVKTAITGLYKLADVNLVREQFEPQLAASGLESKANTETSAEQAGVRYDISPQGLVVWPNASYETEVYYPLDEPPVSNPRPRSLARACGLSAKPLASLVFDYHEMTWDDWRNYWDRHKQGAADPAPPLPKVW